MTSAELNVSYTDLNKVLGKLRKIIPLCHKIYRRDWQPSVQNQCYYLLPVQHRHTVRDTFRPRRLSSHFTVFV